MPLRNGLLGLTGAMVISAVGAQAYASDVCPGPKPESIVVNGSGGSAAAAMREAFTDGFEEKYGITVIDTSPADLGKLRAMVESGNVEWSVTEVGGQDLKRAKDADLLARVDEKIVDRSGFPKEASEEKYAFPKSAYATVMGYSPTAFPDGHPTTWADFWDVEAFPGGRSLRDHPVDNLEFALLADGVAPEDLYPLDLDRAFAKMDEIAPHITVWWKSGQQPGQLLVDGEVDLASGWNGRFYTLIKEGASVEIEWNEGMIKLSSYAIPKGAPHECWGQHYLAFLTDPERQAAYANIIGYPGLHLESPKYVDPVVAPYLPTHEDNIGGLVWTKQDWWTENGKEVTERWNRWKLSN